MRAVRYRAQKSPRTLDIVSVRTAHTSYGGGVFIELSDRGRYVNLHISLDDLRLMSDASDDSMRRSVYGAIIRPEASGNNPWPDAEP